MVLTGILLQELYRRPQYKRHTHKAFRRHRTESCFWVTVNEEDKDTVRSWSRLDSVADGHTLRR